MNQNTLFKEPDLPKRNTGVFISSIISLAAIIVSISQIIVAKTNKQLELELSQLQHDKQLEQMRINNERQWEMDILEYVTLNSDKLFMGTYEEKERLKNIMLITIPAEITNQLFRKIEQTATTDEKQIWTEGLVQSSLMRKKEINKDRRKGITVTYNPKQDENIDWKLFEETLQLENFNTARMKIKLEDQALKNNSLWYGADVYLEDVEVVAQQYISQGGTLKHIGPFTKMGDTKSKMITIGFSKQAEENPTIKKLDL